MSYHAVAPGSIPGVGKDFGLPVDPADILMNGYPDIVVSGFSTTWSPKVYDDYGELYFTSG